MSSIEHLTLRGELKGHNGWVTSIATCAEQPDLIISASRDKSILVWNLTHDAETFAKAVKRLLGHNHYVSDVAITTDGKHALSGSWDGSLRLWDLASGTCKLVFVGHTKDVLSVAFSPDNRQIVSGSRDKTIKIWNTLSKCKYTFSESEKGHSQWVSCVRFSPNPNPAPLMVSAGWDKVVKVWNTVTYKLKNDLKGHEGYVNSVTISPDGSLCASGGKDGKAMLWDITQGSHLSTLEAGDVINALVFSPVRYWLCAATASGIMVWDLESKVCLEQIKLENAGPVGRKTMPIYCTSLCWSPDGQTLYAGYTDNVIRCYAVSRS